MFKAKLALLFVLILLLCQNSSAQTMSVEESGVFTPGGDMTQARSGHTATLLVDGKVLISGGVQSHGVLSSAEVYDPETRVLSPTGDLNVGRYAHTSTLLRDGRVLIAGGIGQNSYEPLRSAEIYDPAAGTFTPAGDMISAQHNHTATLLPDGRVLIAGGQTSFRPIAVAPAEIFDPLTDSFAPAGPYASLNAMWGGTSGPLWPTATLMADGTVFLAGNNPSEIYDPLTDSFHAGPAMSNREYQYGMYWHTSTLLEDGSLLIAGGTDDLQDLADAELFDPTTGAFAATGSMMERRSLHTATLLPSGRVLITGGETWVTAGWMSYFGGSLSSAELYDPSTRTFVPAAGMSIGRSGHTATLLNDGTVLIIGGIQYSPFGSNVAHVFLSSTEIFFPGH